MLQTRLRLVALVLATGLALAYAATALAPRKYVASGGVLLPAGMVKVQYAAADPRHAVALVEDFIRKQRDPLLVDPPMVVRVGPSLAQNLALGAAVGVIFSILLLWRRRRQAVRSENELIAVLGAPLLAARPLEPEAPRELCRQLLVHWFKPGRPLLAVVSAASGEGRTRLAAELAMAFARMGEPTLVVDADFRSPALHRAFGLRNREGLADFLEGRSVKLAHCEDNLSVLVAGRSSADPLELLSRKRLQALLAAAAKRYRVVLIDTPAAARGPDLQIFAALAGGALVVARRPSDVTDLKKLHDLLERCSARVVGTALVLDRTVVEKRRKDRRIVVNT